MFRVLCGLPRTEAACQYKRDIAQIRRRRVTNWPHFLDDDISLRVPDCCLFAYMRYYISCSIFIYGMLMCAIKRRGHTKHKGTPQTKRARTKRDTARHGARRTNTTKSGDDNDNAKGCPDTSTSLTLLLKSPVEHQESGTSPNACSIRVGL